MTIRTRFAPSPTGYLHIGGARTALFSWLYARRHGGTFILRVEDTDLERSTPESVNAILEGMNWLGLNYDEGPFFQTQRFARYREIADQLLTQGKAYRCYCTKERLDALRTQQTLQKEKPRYDGLCRHRKDAPAGLPFVVRFRNPDDGSVVVNDLVKGTVTVDNKELDDLIIQRTDGSPTYNFCVVVDDWDMRITHVIRGEDHLNNTPRQINILRALGATLPRYGHVPMILGPDGVKLSKRHGAVSVMQYRDEGFLPEALLNYLVRLGWSHGDQEVFSLDEMARLFDIEDVNSSAAAFNPSKLLWLNQHYIKTGEAQHIARHLMFHLDALGIDPSGGPDLLAVINAQRERAKTLVELAQNSAFFYRDVAEYDPVAAQKNLIADARAPLEMLLQRLTDLTTWNAPEIHQCIVAVAEQLGLKLGKVAQPVRVAVTGGTVSPPIDSTLEILGREKTLGRLANALTYLARVP